MTKLKLLDSESSKMILKLTLPLFNTVPKGNLLNNNNFVDLVSYSVDLTESLQRSNLQNKFYQNLIFLNNFNQPETKESIDNFLNKNEGNLLDKLDKPKRDTKKPKSKNLIEELLVKKGLRLPKNLKVDYTAYNNRITFKHMISKKEIELFIIDPYTPYLSALKQRLNEKEFDNVFFTNKNLNNMIVESLENPIKELEPLLNKLKVYMECDNSASAVLIDSKNVDRFLKHCRSHSGIQTNSTNLVATYKDEIDLFLSLCLQLKENNKNQQIGYFNKFTYDKLFKRLNKLSLEELENIRDCIKSYVHMYYLDYFIDLSCDKDKHFYCKKSEQLPLRNLLSDSIMFSKLFSELYAEVCQEIKSVSQFNHKSNTGNSTIMIVSSDELFYYIKGFTTKYLTIDINEVDDCSLKQEIIKSIFAMEEDSGFDEELNSFIKTIRGGDLSQQSSHLKKPKNCQFNNLINAVN